MGEINRDGEYPHMTIDKTPDKGWQLCPKCKGVGAAFNGFTTVLESCDVCNGKKIISISTGLPPG